MSAVFADAFFYVALLNRDDNYHARALAFASQSGIRIITTEWVLIEVADAFARSRTRQKIPGFISALEANALTEIIAASSVLFHRGLELYQSRSDKAWTLTDCTSFVVMKDRGISSVLTQDKHFSQAGFSVVFN